MKKSPLKQPIISRFIVKGLLGEKLVDLKLSSNTTILIADNGLGKTTILSIIYAVLSGQIQRLRRIEFDEITVCFSNEQQVIIPSKLLSTRTFAWENDPRLRRAAKKFSQNLLDELSHQATILDYSDFRQSSLVRHVSDELSMPPRYLYDAIQSSWHTEVEAQEDGRLTINQVREKLSEQFPYSVLYFPTYRRIEEELEHLGYQRKEGSRSEGLIQFGMEDVRERIARVTGQIKNSSVEWFAKINGQMLSQLVDNVSVDESARTHVRRQDSLKIVLERIGENISENNKKRIIELVRSDDIKMPQYDSLVYFLSNLLKVYDQQRELDNSIKAFTSVCNRYLVDKEIVYNESSVEIGIYQSRNKKSIELARLSSGEKQIISLFSKLYLDSSSDLALLFDEPELSLSIEWQRMLLPDILNSGRCQYLLATTHSPFIFENELDKNARDLGRFISYTD